MTDEQTKPAKGLFSARNAAILSTLLTAFSGAFYQVYDWAYESGFSAGKLECLEEQKSEADKLKKELRKLKRKKNRNGSSSLPPTEGSN